MAHNAGMRRDDFRLLIVVMVFLAPLTVWGWSEGALVGVPFLISYPDFLWSVC
jgi:hypothetical protein